MDAARDFEETHVHAVYERIARGFSDTRYRQWPRVASFLADEVSAGRVLGVDVGCGNGKNMACPGALLVGVDACLGLLDAAQCSPPLRGAVVRATALRLPLRPASADFCLCVAVLHHVCTPARRAAAVAEMARALRPGGRLLLYVWALEEDAGAIRGGRRRMLSAQFCGRDATASKGGATVSKGGATASNGDATASNGDATEPGCNSGAVSCNPGAVSCDPGAQDVLVPFGASDALRYYHLFARGELEALVCASRSGLRVVSSGWDSENWWVVAEKAASGP